MVIKDLPSYEKVDLEWVLWALLVPLTKGDVAAARRLAMDVIHRGTDSNFGSGVFGETKLFSVSVTYYLSDMTDAGRIVAISTKPNGNGFRDIYKQERIMSKRSVPQSVLEDMAAKQSTMTLLLPTECG